jgi:beta-fructofuranosidase
MSSSARPPKDAQVSRRDFLKTSASTAALASIPAGLRRAVPVGPDDEASLRARLAADPLRPQFHLLPAKNWMNDPNGPIYWKGHYHMFFQYNPNAAVWGDMHWAHAMSDDMIHWRHLPIALAPTPGWDDADGCFTGSAVDAYGAVTILYTGVKTTSPDRATLRDAVHNFREVVCLATSGDPQLRTWNKWKEPVLGPSADPRLTGFRDPFLWREGTTWYMGIGSGLAKQGGQVLLYRSKNLRAWEYLHPLASGKWIGHESINPVDSGEMWECPDFFPLGKKHVLLYSTAGKVIWEAGELDPNELVFRPEKQGILDHGAYYAQKTQLDARGNRILWGWIPERRPDDELRAAGWAGCMALPRLLSLSADGDLQMQVIPEAQSLRGETLHVPGFSTAEQIWRARNFEIKDIAGELFWRSSAPRSTLGLADRTGNWVSVSIDAAATVTKLTLNGTAVELPAAQNPDYRLRLFLDGSVAELLCNDRHVITGRVYRKPDGPLRVSPESSFSQIQEMNLWQLRAVSNNRLTT